MGRRADAKGVRCSYLPQICKRPVSVVLIRPDIVTAVSRHYKVLVAVSVKINVVYCAVIVHIKDSPFPGETSNSVPCPEIILTVA